jgi:hypothetical protein
MILAFPISACSTVTGTSEVSELETKQFQLEGTIEAMGTPAATIQVLQLTAEHSISLLADLTVAQATIIAMQNSVSDVQSSPQYTPAYTGQQVGMPSAGGGLETTTPDAPLIDASSSPSTSNVTANTTLLPVTMATLKDNSNDCAIDSASTFEIYEDIIYAVVTFPEIFANSSVSARWTTSGMVYDESECWPVPSNFTNVCSNCYITPKAGTFDPGMWNVEIMLDGQVIGQAQFQIVDSLAEQPIE